MDKHTIINYVIAIGSVILSVLFYFWSKKKKSPSFEILSTNIITETIKSKINNIFISYNNIEIKNLTVTKIAIWNSGNSTIWKNEIPESNKFRIELDANENIFEHEIIYQDSDSKLLLHRQDNIINLDFEFIEPQNGFIIKITHSSLNSEKIRVLGKVIGGDNISRINDFSRNVPNEEKDSWWLKYLVMVMFGIILFYTFSSEMQIYFKVLFMFTCLIIFAAAFTQSIQKKVPKKLHSIFYQE